MNAHASPFVPALQPDTSLGAFLAALAPHESKSLVFAYEDGRQVQVGYHVTEVKAGSFVTLDCGGNPDAWQETILQVEDIPANGDATCMRVSKLQSILAQVDRKLRLNGDARLTIEVSLPDEPMRIYDVAEIDSEGREVIVRLGARPAICKPRHRAQQAETALCCSPTATRSACCA